MADLQTGHKINPNNLLSSKCESLTLKCDLEQWVKAFRMTHRLIMINIYANLFQNPSMNDRFIDQTWNASY